MRQVYDNRVGALAYVFRTRQAGVSSFNRRAVANNRLYLQWSCLTAELKAVLNCVSWFGGAHDPR